MESCAERLHRIGNDKSQHCSQEYQCHQEHGTYLRAYPETHDHAGYEHYRRSDRYSYTHLESILDIGYIRGHPGYKSCGGELIYVREGESLYLAVYLLPEITGKTCGSLCRIRTCQCAEHQAEHCCDYHYDTILDHNAQITLSYAVIDYLCSYERQQHLHHNFKHHADRCCDGRTHILLYL